MKRIWLALMILMIGLAVTGCSSRSSSKEGGLNGYTMEELKEIHEVMFRASNSNMGLLNADEDFWSSTTIQVYFDGTIKLQKNYNLSGTVVDVETELSEEDYRTLLDFLEKEFVTGNCDTEVEACDGDIWSFIYYNPDGDQLHRFDGYSYGIEELEKIQTMLYTYMPEQ